MQDRPAKFVSALVVGLVAAGALTIASSHVARAAECLTAPDTSDGGRWRYRTDRANNRKCWYNTEDKQRSSEDEQSAAEQASPLPKAEPAMPRQFANARAELEASRAATEQSSVFPVPAAKAAPQTTDKSGTLDALDAAASRWTLAERTPDRTYADNTTSPELTAADRADADADADAPSNATGEATPDSGSAPVAAPPLPTARPSGPANSVRMLMIGLAGSLACAGLIAGTVIKLANIRRKRRRSKVRRKMWDVPFNTHRAPLRLETESLPVELDEEPWPLQPFEEPEPAPETLPRWLQIARARFEADRASEEIEGLLSRASRTATH